MGQIIQVQCTKCDYQKELFIGGGLMDCELKTILAALPAEGQRVLSGAVNYGASQFSVTRKISRCNSCGEVYALPVVSYMLKNLSQELYGVCPECGAAGKAGKNVGLPCCPSCGGEMTQRKTGHWD